MKRKKYLWLIFFVFLLFTACTSDEKGKLTSPANMERKDKDVVELVLWDYFKTEPESSAVEQLIEKFMKVNPNVKITRESIPLSDMVNKLLLGSATGQLPDLILTVGGNLPMYAAAGMLADITEEVEVWGEKDQYHSALWGSNTYNGRIYGIPMGSTSVALYYNKDLLTKAGVVPPSNWDELKSTAEKVSQLGIFGFQASAARNDQTVYSFLPFIWQSGADIESINSKETLNALNLWKDMIDLDYMSKESLNMGFQGISKEFLSGNVAMIINGSWLINVLDKEASFDWDVSALPSGEFQATALGEENWAIISTSKQKQVAWDFIKFSQKETHLKEFLLQIGRLPARKELAQDLAWHNDSRLKVFTDTMTIAKPHIYGPKYPEISGEIQNMLQQVLSGQKSPEAAIKEADEKIKLLLRN